MPCCGVPALSKLALATLGHWDIGPAALLVNLGVTLAAAALMLAAARRLEPARGMTKAGHCCPAFGVCKEEDQAVCRRER